MARQPQIIVGVDGSTESTMALRSAVALSRLTGADVTALHAWMPPLAYGGFPVFPSVDWHTAAQILLRDVVTSALADSGDSVAQSVLEGHAASVLIDYAEEPDVLVVGARGRGGLAGMLLGSVTGAVVAHARCPVLVIRGSAQPLWSASAQGGRREIEATPGPPMAVT